MRNKLCKLYSKRFWSSPDLLHQSDPDFRKWSIMVSRVVPGAVQPDLVSQIWKEYQKKWSSFLNKRRTGNVGMVLFLCNFSIHPVLCPGRSAVAQLQEPSQIVARSVFCHLIFIDPLPHHGVFYIQQNIFCIYIRLCFPFVVRDLYRNILDLNHHRWLEVKWTKLRSIF